eukprot:2235747-Lingulodinium_polyedra.AAC.1
MPSPASRSPARGELDRYRARVYRADSAQFIIGNIHRKPWRVFVLVMCLYSFTVSPTTTLRFAKCTRTLRA